MDTLNLELFKSIIDIRKMDKQTDMFSTRGARSDQYEYTNHITGATGNFYMLPGRFNAHMSGFVAEEIKHTIAWFCNNREAAYEYSPTVTEAQALQLDKLQRAYRHLKQNYVMHFVDKPLLQDALTRIERLAPGPASRQHASYAAKAAALRAFLATYNNELVLCMRALKNDKKTGK